VSSTLRLIAYLSNITK